MSPEVKWAFFHHFYMHRLDQDSDHVNVIFVVIHKYVLYTWVSFPSFNQTNYELLLLFLPFVTSKLKI